MRRLLTAALVLVAALIAVQPVSAAPPTAVSGQFALTDVLAFDFRPIDNTKEAFTETIELTFTGDVDVIAIFELSGMVDLVTGRETNHGTATATGTVLGRSGTFQAEVTSSPRGGSGFMPLVHVLSGTGALEGIQMQLTVDTVAGTYSGSAHLGHPKGRAP